MVESEILPRSVVWAALDPIRGREHGGHRPLVVVASADYLESVSTLVIAVPLTTVDRGWPNHVRAVGPTGLSQPSWIMTEQPRTLSRDRLTGVTGLISPECFSEVRLWLSDFLGFAAPQPLEFD